MKLRIHSLTSMTQSSRFWNGYIYSSHTLWPLWWHNYLSMLGLKLIHICKRGHRVCVIPDSCLPTELVLNQSEATLEIGRLSLVTSKEKWLVSPRYDIDLMRCFSVNDRKYSPYRHRNRLADGVMLQCMIYQTLCCYEQYWLVRNSV